LANVREIAHERPSQDICSLAAALAGCGADRVVLLAVPFVAALGGQAWVRIANFAILYIFLALGLNIVVGYAGLLDLGYVAFYAVGAYVYALLASPHFGCTCHSGSSCRWVPASPVSSGCCSVRRR
jgi:ABC-type branched-subunit amino acid transport system permease subunit